MVLLDLAGLINRLLVLDRGLREGILMLTHGALTKHLVERRVLLLGQLAARLDVRQGVVHDALELGVRERLAIPKGTHGGRGELRSALLGTGQGVRGRSRRRDARVRKLSRALLGRDRHIGAGRARDHLAATLAATLVSDLKQRLRAEGCGRRLIEVSGLDFARRTLGQHAERTAEHGSLEGSTKSRLEHVVGAIRERAVGVAHEAGEARRNGTHACLGRAALERLGHDATANALGEDAFEVAGHDALERRLGHA